jgi:hypothetical protein
MYGFKKPVQWINLKHMKRFEHHYQSVLHYRNQKWNQLLADHENQFPPLNAKGKKETPPRKKKEPTD